MRYRTGRKLGRTIYRQEGPFPTDDDVFVGIMDKAEDARLFCALANVTRQGDTGPSAADIQRHPALRRNDSRMPEDGRGA